MNDNGNNCNCVEVSVRKIHFAAPLFKTQFPPLYMRLTGFIIKCSSNLAVQLIV
jgi:hypothetical protein